MSTTDSNGLVVLDENDPLVPYQALVNTVTASVSGALDLTVRTFKAANQAARDALATQRPPSPSDPLQVWRVDKKYFEINDGSGWKSISSDSTKEIINGTAYNKSGSIQATISSWTRLGTSTYEWTGYTTVALPYTPPEGWTFRVTVTASPSEDFVFSAWKRTSDFILRCRYYLWAQATSKTFTLGWELIKA